MTTTVDTLRAHYDTIEQLTETLIDCIEQDSLDDLEPIIEARAMEIDHAGTIVARLSPTESALIPADLTAKVSRLTVRDQRLRNLLFSASTANNDQLAQVRGSRARFGGYQPQNPDRPELVDRRG